MASEVKERSFTADLAMGNGERLKFVEAQLGPMEYDKNDFLYASTTVSEPLTVYFRCEGDVGYVLVMETSADGEALPVANGFGAGTPVSLEDRIKEPQQVDPHGGASLSLNPGSMGGGAELPQSVRDLLGDGSSNAQAGSAIPNLANTTDNPATPKLNSVVTKKYFGVDELGRVFRTSKVEQASYFKIFGRDKTSPGTGAATEFVYLKSTKSGEFIHVNSLTLGGASESGGTLMKLTVQKRYNSDGSVKTQ